MWSEFWEPTYGSCGAGRLCEGNWAIRRQTVLVVRHANIAERLNVLPGAVAERFLLPTDATGLGNMASGADRLVQRAARRWTAMPIVAPPRTSQVELRR